VGAAALAAAISVTALPGAVSAGGTDLPADVRFATFNASLNRSVEGQLIADLSTADNAQASTVAEIVQRVRPAVLLVNEFDYDADGVSLGLFQDNYLSVAHNGAEPISYPYRYSAPSNTGIPSGFDLDNDGVLGEADDALGFGFFPGQYGMAVYSMHPIDTAAVRTFQNFLWKDMPNALLPDDPTTPEPADWFSAEELDVVRLSSKSHWDIPVEIEGETVHFLVSHPTPPVFDGDEDRNGRRNHDEIKFWRQYLKPKRAGYIYDDAGVLGGLPHGVQAVVAGDQNADPLDGDSVEDAADQLLQHRRLNDPSPASVGGPEAAEIQGGANETHVGDPLYDTADFDDVAPGNLRVDYVLPSRGLLLRGSGVFWPATNDPLYYLTGAYDPTLPGAFPSSDHRLVWTDVQVRNTTVSSPAP